MMTRQLTTILVVLLIGFNSMSQSDYFSKKKKEREEHIDYVFSDSSFLDSAERSQLTQINYFKIDSNYIVTAKLKKKKGPKFEMITSTDRKPIYRRYGILTFKLKDSSLSIPIYQNMKLLKTKKYKKYLFLPIRDLTTSKESYGAGRYLELEIPKGKFIQLDFNDLFNPYCATSARYSCPVTPIENTLNIRIEAGEKIPTKKK